jgi:hypothetical protein
MALHTKLDEVQQPLNNTRLSFRHRNMHIGIQGTSNALINKNDYVCIDESLHNMKLQFRVLE